MLKSILVASDLSSRSKAAVQRAVQIAETNGATLTVLHVVEDDLFEDRMREEIGKATEYLSEQVAGFGLSNQSEVTVATGHAFHVICEYARERAADLVVMGAHRRQSLRDVFTGTTIERVTRTVDRPVLMANSKTAERWRKVFVATDLSETACRAAKTAHHLGFFEGAEVSFVHGYASITRQMMNHAGLSTLRVHEEADKELRSVRSDLEQFIQEAGLGDLTYTTRIIEGVGSDAIADLVEQSSPDLLVLGTRGLSGVKRLFLGSVAQDLMGCVNVDVLAVPAQARDFT